LSDIITERSIGNDTEIVKISDRILSDTNLSKHTHTTNESAVARATLGTIISKGIKDTPKGRTEFIKTWLLNVDRYSCSIDGKRAVIVSEMVGNYELNKLKNKLDENTERDKLNIDE